MPTLLPRLHVRRVRQEGSGAARQGRVVTVSGNARERVVFTAGSSTPPKPDSLAGISAMHPLRPILHWTPHWQTPRCLWQQLQELGHATGELPLDRVASELTIEDFDSQGRFKVVKLNAKALNDGVEKLFF